MAKVFIEETTLTNIGNAIRDKEGSSALIPVTDMATRIAAIETGGGGGGDSGIPESAFNISGDAIYRFAYGNWDWFIEQYGDKITTTRISNCMHMFNMTQVEEIPFTINTYNYCDNFMQMFRNSRLRVCPKIRGQYQGSNPAGLDCSEMVENCFYIRDLEDLFDEDFTTPYSSVPITSTYSPPKFPRFRECYSMRQVPSWFYKFGYDPHNSTTYPYYFYSVSYGCFEKCFALDEILDFPVISAQGEPNGDMFASIVSNCLRLKNFTFKTQEDGTPYIVQWRNQTLNFCNNTGWVDNNPYDITRYNSGITVDKAVNSDATYQALKDDPDWFATNIAYSRYNHDSAVATINSLPDAYDYVYQYNGANQIKFRGPAGSATDGGAINTLTEEEIAVAVSKGWTVAFE